MKKYFAEFISTFILVFCGTGAIVINEISGGVITHSGIALTFGLVVLAMIYSIGDISGAHMNPAVTIAFALSKKFPWNNVLPYCAAQITGALLASLILKLLFPFNQFLGSTLPQGSETQSFILEFLLTFILMFVIFNVSSGAKEKGISAGIAVASVVALAAMFAGPISGASMNPARSIAPAIISGHIQHLWLYIMAPVTGASVAFFIFKLIRD
ncbi:MAG: aquaporin [Bacteroidetes bacterium]|nr:aquaporin [Bacteroidota bacterium]